MAKPSDIPRIIEMGSRSLLDGPYAGIIKENPDQFAKFAAVMVMGATVLVAEEEGRVCGLLAFATADHHFSGEKYSAELMWYVEPEHRKGGVAIKMMWEAERIAKEQGSKHFVFTAPTDEVAALYKRFGYSQLEVNYRKAL